MATESAPHRYAQRFVTRGNVQPAGEAFAPANIALCKYWGKRDRALNLPCTDSLSVSLGALGTRTRVSFAAAESYTLNGRPVGPDANTAQDQAFAKRLQAFLDLHRLPGEHFAIETKNTIPTAAGLASSASGFAALTLALADMLDWAPCRGALSRIARLGSGSACRSLWHGFVRWRAGNDPEGSDSFAEPLSLQWLALRIGVVPISTATKSISSRAAMNATVDSSPLYQGWAECVARDMAEIESAISARDLTRLGCAAERNALAMHATMLGASTPVLYWQPETITALATVQQLRRDGISVFATMDAGPNVKVIFEEQDALAVAAHFPALQQIAPFEAIPG